MTQSTSQAMAAAPSLATAAMDVEHNKKHNREATEYELSAMGCNIHAHLAEQGVQPLADTLIILQ